MVRFIKLIIRVFTPREPEQFLQEKDKIDGEWPKIYGEVTEISESNYFSDLEKISRLVN